MASSMGGPRSQFADLAETRTVRCGPVVYYDRGTNRGNDIALPAVIYRSSRKERDGPESTAEPIKQTALQR